MKSAFWLRNLFIALAAASLAFVAPGPPLTHAQEASTPPVPLAFDVATVKRVDRDKIILVDLRVYPGGRLLIRAYNLRMLIATAFNVPVWQVVGGQDWVDDLRYEIEGKPPEQLRNSIPGGEYSNAGLQNPQLRSMLQTLLIDRFQLKFHLESRPGTVYLLKRGNGPLRLKQVEVHLYTRSADGSVTPNNNSSTGDIGMTSGLPLTIDQASMPQLARALSGDQRAPVIDQTGLPGFYNFESRTVVTMEDFKNGGLVNLLTEALPEMGLKLVKTQGTVEKLVIDNVEQPTPN
jgi:uncharacterized protein (TIGR03435 family)